MTKTMPVTAKQASISWLPAAATDMGPASALAILALAIAFGMAGPLSVLFSHIPRQYNEGWNAYLADIAMAGGRLYPSEGGLFFNNYPPLSFYLVGEFGRLIGDNIFAGRLLAFASLVVVAANIALVAIRLGADKASAIFAGLLFCLYMVTAGSQYVATNDPQMLAHALQTSGLLVLSNAALTVRRVVLATCLIWLGGFTKHNLFALPAAITLAFVMLDGRALRAWLATGLSLSAVAICAAMSFWGRAFLSDILFHPRVVSFDRMWTKAFEWLLPTTPYVALATFGLLRSPARTTRLILILYLGTSVAAAAVSVAGDGVSINAVFDLAIASCIGTALAAAWVVARLRTSYVLLALALPMLVHLPAAIKNQQRLAKNAAFLEQWDAMISTLGSADGPVACEMLALCYWAGKPPEVDFLNAGQAIETRRLPASALIDPIAARRFAVIQVGDPNHRFGATTSQRLPSQVRGAIEANYQSERASPLALLVPAK